MTYFGQQKKKINEIVKKNSFIGPGTYCPKIQQNKNQSYAPFGSLLKKQGIVKDAKHNKQGLGPGSYNINRQIIKPSILHYENENCIIIKINEEGCSQFKSKIDRFGNKNTTETPGPGSYIFNNQRNTQRRRTKSVGSVVYRMKELYNNQYVNRRKPTLSSDKPIIPYQDNKPKQNTKGVVNWGLNKKQRFQSQPKQTFKDEDKSILLDKATIDKKKQKMGVKQSSFFASKSVKSCFDQMIYRTSNPFKVQIRKMLGFEDRSPGPGTYNYRTASISEQKKPLQFQFFGSTVERFQSNQGKEPSVGPGDYQIKQNRSQKFKNKLKKIKSLVKRPLTQLSEQEQNLGPGTYSIQNKINSKLSFNRKYNSGAADFGSRQPRFQTEHEIKRQQKSQYISFMAQQDQQKKKRIEQQFNFRRNALKNKKHCVFSSQTKRFETSFQEAKKNNPFGLYEVGVEDIGNRIKKQKQYDNQFSQCNLTKPGFLSSVQRFKTQVQEEPSHIDCWCLIKQVEKKNIDHFSPSFQSNSKKSEVFDVKNKGPPVGQYSKSSSLIKQSFNSRFIKQNQNKTKKIKIWKDKEHQ